MKNNFLENLSEFQKDALKEIGNIGAGNAATAFAQFLDQKIKMNVPSVEILPLSRVPEITGNVEETVFGILVQIMGEAPGYILFILAEESIVHLLNSILGKKVNLSDVSDLEQSAIKEIGNILSGSYLNAINQVTGFNLTQAVPGLAHDMAGAILSSTMISMGNSSDYALLIETQFHNGKKKIDGYFFLIPEPGSLKIMLDALGFDENARD